MPGIRTLIHCATCIFGSYDAKRDPESRRPVTLEPREGRPEQRHVCPKCLAELDAARGSSG